MRNTKYYTIPELVTTIIILAVIITLIYNPLMKDRPARKTKAKAEVMSIVIAIKSYESTYGYLPYGEGKTKEDLSVDNQYNILMELLTCEKSPGQCKTVLTNARKIKFIDPPNSYKEKGILDPWGNKYKIIIDTNNDGSIIFNGEEIKEKVMVYSYGKDKKDDKGKNDDICSWKE